MCVHTPQLNRWTDRRENWPKNSESNTSVIRGFTDCHIVDLATESPRELNFRPKIVATLDGSLAEIAKNSRIKFRYLKKRREISHLIISSEPIYEAEARIFIVQSATKFGSRCPTLLCAIKKKFLRRDRASYFRYACCSEDWQAARKIVTARQKCVPLRRKSFRILDVLRDASSIMRRKRWHWSYLDTSMQKSTPLLLHRSVLGNLPGGGGRQDGAAAGVFQIITSGCGGGGSPWQPQCLQHPTTEGNRATERRNPVLSCCGLRNPDARARGPVGNGFPRTSAARLHRRWWNWINNHGLVIRECTFRVSFFFLRTLPNKMLPLLWLFHFTVIFVKYFLFN